MNADVTRWLEEDGVAFLRQIGVTEGQDLLDFGAGEGHYAIPAAKIVAPLGKVYAIERDRAKAAQLRQLRREYGIGNLEVVHSDSLVELPSDSIDIALCYDVIHFMDRSARKGLYAEIRRVLKEEGCLSVYPKHRQDDEPLMELQHSDLQAVIGEIESEGFALKSTSFHNLLHDDYRNEGCILNFEKRSGTKCSSTRVP